MHSTNNHKFLLYIIICLIIVSVSLPLYAAEVEGVYYSDSYMVDNKKLSLTAVGLLRYWGFKAYTGAFYLEEETPVKDFLTDRTKRIELEYFRSIKGEDFGPATNKSIAKNVESKTFDRLRPRIDYHNSLDEDVRPGDRYSLTYVPGKGTELARNGEPKGLIGLMTTELRPPHSDSTRADWTARSRNIIHVDTFATSNPKQSGACSSSGPLKASTGLYFFLMITRKPLSGELKETTSGLWQESPRSPIRNTPQL